MRRGFLSLLAILALAGSLAGPLGSAACLVPEAMVPRPEFVHAVDSDSDKAVSIVRNPRIDEHEPGPILPQTVANAMLASGFFTDDDAKALAGPIAAEMPRMGTREQLRIVGWAEDGLRVYYAIIHGGKLRLAYHKGTEELDRHEAVIPTEAVAMGSIPEPASLKGQAPPQPLEASTAQPAAASTAQPAAAAAAPKPQPPRAAPPRAPARSVAMAAPPPITEEEARRKLRALDELLGKNLITPAEHKRGKREILIRL